MSALAAALDTAANLRAFADALCRRAEQRITSAISDELNALEGVTWTGREPDGDDAVLWWGSMVIDGNAVDVDVQAQMDAPARWSVWIMDHYGTIHGSADTAAGAMAKARAAWVKR